MAYLLYAVSHGSMSVRKTDKQLLLEIGVKIPRTDLESELNSPADPVGQQAWGGIGAGTS
jgi:hypothetical protein